MNDTNGTVNEVLPGWIPENIKDYQGKRVQMKLLCGADLLESFSVPGLWKDEDVGCILSGTEDVSELIFDEYIFSWKQFLENMDSW